MFRGGLDTSNAEYECPDCNAKKPSPLCNVLLLIKSGETSKNVNFKDFFFKFFFNNSRLQGVEIFCIVISAARRLT